MAKQCNNNDLKILHWNIRSTKSNRSDLIKLIIEETPQIITINETLLKFEENFKISGYSVKRQDRADGWGGVAILVANYNRFNQWDIDTTSSPERFQAIDVKLENLTTITGYNPPNVSI